MPIGDEITIYCLFLLKTEGAEGAYGKRLHTQELKGRQKLVLC